MKVGDYVRSSWGTISKIEKYTPFDDGKGFSILLEGDNNSSHYRDKFEFEIVYKSSPNIIDLIEVGDYVNGYYVNEITDIDTGLPVLCNFDLNTMRWTPLENIDIWYSILTKEQFESTEYKVGW